MTRAGLVLIAASGSAALLIGALLFQHVGDLAPCKLCIWQRWPHAGAILAAGIALLVVSPLPVLLGAAAALTTAGIGIYHVGVEQSWWQGPSTCTSAGVGGQSVEDLMAQIMAAPLVQCDQIAWSMAGISMAGWNAIISLGLAVIWLAALRRA